MYVAQTFRIGTVKRPIVIIIVIQKVKIFIPIYISAIMSHRCDLFCQTDGSDNRFLVRL